MTDTGPILLLPFERRYWGRRRLAAGLPLWGNAVFCPQAETRFEEGERVSSAAGADGAWSARMETPPPTQDAFTTMGLTSVATEADVKRAYKRLALEHHPDRGGSAAAFTAVTAARDSCLAFIQAAERGSSRP